MRLNKIKPSLITSCAAFIFLLQVSIYAQNSFGIFGGINHSTLKISDKTPGTTIESVTGYSFGLLLGYDISESYSIVLQPRYIIKGEDVTWDSPFLPDWAENRFNYLELPIYLQASLNQSNLRPFIFTGINFGILFSAISKVRYYNEISELTLTDGYNKLDLALDLGIGIEYLINLKYSLSLDVRYSHGLLNLAKEGTLNFRGIQGVIGFIYQL